MTKALCIKQGPWRWVHEEIVNGPKYMEEVEIEGEKGEGDRRGYYLKGYNVIFPGTSIRGNYNVRHFIPLSNIDETELINQKQDELCESL